MSNLTPHRFLCLTALGALTACAPPWYLRPEQPSRIESLSGPADAFRVCLAAKSGPLQAAQLETESGATPGAIDPAHGAPTCALFRGQAAARALEGPSTLVLEQRGASTSTSKDRIPLTGGALRWQPYSRLEVATRALYLVPVAAGYSDLLELHPSLRYRVAPALRIGAAFEARLGARTALFGTGPSLSLAVPLAARWVAGVDAEYVVGTSAYARANWDGQWFHGPSALIALGRTQPRFLGSPSILDSGAFGPMLSAEYLFVPKRHDALLVLGAGLYIRYGL